MTKIAVEREVIEQALEALEAALSDDRPYIEKSKQATTALRQALEQPQCCTHDCNEGRDCPLKKEKK